MGLIDTHCHIAGKEFDADRAAVLARAWEAGLSAMIIIGAGDGMEGNERAIALAQTDPRLFCAIGIHPHDAGKGAGPDALTFCRSPDMEASAKRSPASPAPLKIVAIGETGLDYHYDHVPREVQQQCFREQLSLAHEWQLPVIIHSRDAWEDTLRVLKETGIPKRKGVFHCFGETVDDAERAIALGFYISIPGILTFKKPGHSLEVVKHIPLEKILIETDAPYLAPIPHRGKRNEPAFVKHVAEKIAEIRGISYEEVVRQTTENAIKLFSLSPCGRG